jgi:hypothetical protein
MTKVLNYLHYLHTFVYWGNWWFLTKTENFIDEIKLPRYAVIFFHYHETVHNIHELSFNVDIQITERQNVDKIKCKKTYIYITNHA